jgi:hypothetical protein
MVEVFPDRASADENRWSPFMLDEGIFTVITRTAKYLGKINSCLILGKSQVTLHVDN